MTNDKSNAVERSNPRLMVAKPFQVVLTKANRGETRSADLDDAPALVRKGEPHRIHEKFLTLPLEQTSKMQFAFLYILMPNKTADYEKQADTPHNGSLNFRDEGRVEEFMKRHGLQ